MTVLMIVGTKEMNKAKEEVGNARMEVGALTFGGNSSAFDSCNLFQL